MQHRRREWHHCSKGDRRRRAGGLLTGKCSTVVPEPERIPEQNAAVAGVDVRGPIKFFKKHPYCFCQLHIRHCRVSWQAC